MRIAAWSLACYRLPYAREVVWANAVERAGTFALLRLIADSGEVGIAEGTLKDTWSGASPGSLRAALDDLILPQVQAIDISDPATVAAALARIPENRLAKGLVDSACWTLRAAAAGTPLWKLWGGSASVDLTWAITRQPPAEMAAEAADMCSRYGFRTLKVKGGQGVATDLAALREIRAAVGDAVALYVDANSAYPRDQALPYVQALAAAGVTVAEDPCPLLPDRAFEALQHASGLPILVDSGCTSARDAHLYLERGAQALAAKPGRIGLSAARDIALQAARCGARAAVGLYAESALGTLISLQQAAAMPAAATLVAAEQTFFLIMREQVTADDLRIHDGRLTLPDTARFDSLVDWDKVGRFAL